MDESKNIPMLQRLKHFALRIAKRWAKGFLLSCYYPYLYKRWSRCSVKNGKVLFLDNKEPEVPDSFGVLYERLSYAPELKLSFMSLGETRVRFLAQFQNTVAFLKEMSTAQYVFLNDASNVVSCVRLRPETKVVQLWHGCGAFKKWGMSTADLIFGGSREELLRHPYYKNLSLVTVSSPEVCWAYEEAMVLQDQPQIVQPIGVSRTDAFFDHKYISKSYERVYGAAPRARGKKIILYAPTFRGRVAAAKGPDQLDIEKMRQGLEGEYVLLVKHHPFVKNPPSIPESCRDFAFDVSRELSVNELLCCSDICISDYSSLVFEYSLFGRPMIFFSFDREEYSDWRGFYYDYETLAPGPVFTRTEEIVDYIVRIDECFDAKRVEEFKQKFMASCDGRATERIIRTVFGEDIESSIEDERRRRICAEPLVSVIVPVHNASSTLRDCLNSITAQTLDRIEIICVNDGSTDDSLEVIRQYAAEDSRIIVLNQENLFAGVARNNGMSIAKGKYLVFWDADDYFDLDALRLMYEQCEVDEADVCVCGARQQFMDTGELVTGSMYIVKSYLPEMRPFSLRTNEEGILNFTTLVAWNKMFRRSFIESVGARFGLTRYNEDVIFTAIALCEARAITLVERDLITYRRNQRNALTGRIDESAFDLVEAWEKTCEQLKCRGCFPKVSYANRVAASLIYTLRNMTSYEGFALAASKIAGNVQRLGISVEDIRIPWQKRFFRSLRESGINQALVCLMNETYLQELRANSRRAAEAQRVRDLKKRNADLRKKLDGIAG